MAKKDLIKRLIYEIDRLHRPASYREVLEYLEARSELLDEDYSISSRTLRRDIADISSIFHIEIGYDRSKRKYSITENEDPLLVERISEAFSVWDAFYVKDSLRDYVHVDGRHPSGTQFLKPLINAAKKRQKVSFLYEKFGSDGKPDHRTVAPYGVKEYRNWWFLLAKDDRGEKLKCFGLDRISELKPVPCRFERDRDFDINEFFRYAYGATVFQDMEPQEVVLSITGEEIYYVKARPLHHTQETISETKDELKVRLTVYITWELVDDIRGKGEYISVVSPLSLRDSIAKMRYRDLFRH